MGRNYAGILGLVAFLVTLLRGFVGGGEPESIVLDAWLCLLAFTAIGFVAGQLAQWIVDDSVRDGISRELAAQEAAEAESPPQAG